MTVPLSEAVARRVPAALSARKARGALCAWMALATVSERVEKRRTSRVMGYFCFFWAGLGVGLGPRYGQGWVGMEEQRSGQKCKICTLQSSILQALAQSGKSAIVQFIGV